MFERGFEGPAIPRARRRARPRFGPALECLDDRVLLSGVTATYTVQNDWGSGFQAQVALNNSNATSVANWQLQFDLAASISSIWSARIKSHVGNHYVVSGLSWDTAIPASSSLAFGFVAAPGGPAPSPANYVLNGVPLGTTSTPVLSASNATANVSSTTAGTAVFTVTLSQAATTPVTVNYATADGTAKAGIDYTAASGTLTIPAGQTRGTITIAVPKAATWKADATFTLNLSSPSGATLGTSQAVGTVHSLNTPPATGAVTYVVTSDWGSGFNGEIDIKNSGVTALNNWSLEFDFSGTISSIWNATISSQVGTHYTMVPVSWNGSIAPGATVAIGFGASPGGGVVAPANFILHPTPTGGGGGTITAPTAVADTATTTQGVPVSIAVLANDTDPNGLALSFASITQPKNGTAVINSDRTITYTPIASFLGGDSFTYTITDSKGGTSTATVTVNVIAPPAPPTWSAHEFSPYVDMGLYPTYDLVSAAKTAGIRDFTLAFIVPDAAGKPSWGGYSAYEVSGTAFDLALRSQVNSLRAIGGDVMVSFGGASGGPTGQELAQAITDVTALKGAYQGVIDAYNLSHIDFDIEGGAEADHASIDRRSQALAALQKDMAAAKRPLEIWLTLPVLPTGLTADGLYVVQSAIKYGVRLGGVNVMAMDYGESAAPSPKGQMGTYAIQAGTSLFGQLKTLYGTSLTDTQLWSMVGITPMIGMNDDTLEVFDQTAAQQLITWAKSKGIGRLSFWSLNRDQQNPAGALTYVDLKSSSLLQKPYEFSTIFETFVS